MHKGFWIPIELLELDVSWTKRILLAEISQLEMEELGCIASNNHFATKLKLTRQAISKALNELNKDGYIVINNAQTKRNFGRTITINFSVSGVNFGKSGVHESGETKENKQTNKHINKQEAIPFNVQRWINYRKEIKKPISKTTIASLVKEQTKDPRAFHEKVEHSISNGYQGLFAPNNPSVGLKTTRDAIDDYFANKPKEEYIDAQLT